MVMMRFLSLSLLFVFFYSMSYSQGIIQRKQLASMGAHIRSDDTCGYSMLNVAGEMIISKKFYSGVFTGNLGYVNIDDTLLTNCIPTTLTNDVNEDSKFIVYPNPNNGSFTLRITSNKSDRSTILISDILGRQIVKENVEGANGERLFHYSNFSPGIYVMTFQAIQGSGTVKITVQ